MGGTVLDMFTLGATPFSLSLYSFPRGGGDTILAPPSYLPPPLSPSSFSFPLSLLLLTFSLFFLSFFLFFFPFFHELSQKRHANTRGARRPTNYADRRGGGEKLLEFWLNTVPLMDGASSWRSWKHVIHPADRSTGAPKYELSTRNVALSSAFYIYEHGDSRRGR